MEYYNFEQNKESRYESIDLQDLLQAWPKFEIYLKQNSNFYERLENIFFERLSVEDQPSFIQSIREYLNF